MSCVSMSTYIMIFIPAMLDKYGTRVRFHIHICSGIAITGNPQIFRYTRFFFEEI